MGIAVTPCQPNKESQDLRIKITIHRSLPPEAPKADPQGPEPREAVPRRAWIRKQDLEDHGFIAGCLGCTSVRQAWKTQRPHNLACRERFEGIWRGTAVGQERLQRAQHFAQHRLQKGPNGCFASLLQAPSQYWNWRRAHSWPSHISVFRPTPS